MTTKKATLITLGAYAILGLEDICVKSFIEFSLCRANFNYNFFLFAHIHGNHHYHHHNYHYHYLMIMEISIFCYTEM